MKKKVDARWIGKMYQMNEHSVKIAQIYFHTFLTKIRQSTRHFTTWRKELISRKVSLWELISRSSTLWRAEHFFRSGNSTFVIWHFEKTSNFKSQKGCGDYYFIKVDFSGPLKNGNLELQLDISYFNCFNLTYET